jgi:hypothetical protein
MIKKAFLAPVTLFVYNRPWHTRQTVETLKKNELANESELFIFSDAPKNEGAEKKVKEVREFIKKIEGFKKVTIIEREKNWGLADSIIDGVTNIVNKYGKIIVLEDDLVTSPYFLKFMNEALEYYKDEKKVWHISGWNYPIDTSNLSDVFFWRVMNCWGWATWQDRWECFSKDIDKTINDFSKKEIKQFNLDGAYNFWKQVIDNKNGKISTWAIFWYATIFKQNGLCLNPSKTFVKNIGNDGSGENCGKTNKYCANLSFEKKIKFINTINEDKVFLFKIKKFFRAQRKTFLARFVNKLSRMFIGKNL